MWWIVAGAAVLIVIAGVAAVPLVVVPMAQHTAVATDPVSAVRAYFQALTDRDGDKARALLAPIPTPSTQADQDMLSARTLRDPGYTPPQNVEVTLLKDQPSGTTVRARFEVAGQHPFMDLQLYRGGPGSPPAWRISYGLRPMYVPEVGYSGAVLIVAGNTVPANHTVMLSQVFPGSYLAKLPENPIHQAAPVTLYAGNASSIDKLKVQVRPEVAAAVEPQVRAFLAGCEASIQVTPAPCPFGRRPELTAIDVRFKIITYPTLGFRLDNTGNASVFGTGRVLITGVYGTADSNRPFQQDYEFSIGGTVKPDAGGKPVYAPGS